MNFAAAAGVCSVDLLEAEAALTLSVDALSLSLNVCPIDLQPGSITVKVEQHPPRQIYISTYIYIYSIYAGFFLNLFVFIIFTCLKVKLCFVLFCFVHSWGRPKISE